MSKKGVSMISGNISPIVGESITYNIIDWYPETPLTDRNPLKVTWELFRKRENGKFTTTHIKKKGINNFTFGETSWGNTYRLEAYLHEPEGGGLIIKPKPSKIPKINKVDLLYVDDSKGSTFSYIEKLRAKAQCVNLNGKELLFTIWEDDAKNSGYNPTNKAIETKKVKVDRYGVATAEFMLTRAFMEKAMRGEADSKQLEFYVTVEYYKGKIHDSENVEIKNPRATPSPIGTKPPEKKRAIKAKGSPAEQKPASKKEEKGIWDNFKDYLHDWAEAKGTVTKEKEPTQAKNESVSTSGVGKKAPEKKKKEEKLIIFPLLVKPENDDKNKWVKDYNWSASPRDNMATFNSNRSGNRRHAARDLYTKPLESVVAIAPGEVLQVKSFYDRTDQVTIRHKLKDGRDFIIRYGELDPKSITVKKGDQVKQKKEIGKTGKLMKTDTEVRLKIGGITVYMLHFECFTGTGGFNVDNSPLTNSTKPFMRRSDLVDSFAILQEGYKNTFGDTATRKNGNRIPPKTLITSQKGKDFIKDWEAFGKKPYDDSEGYATIGFGYLLAYKSYKNIKQSDIEKTEITWKEFQEGISEARALELFNKKVKKYEKAVQRDITVNLHQSEFDALVSLLFNTGSEFLNTGGANGGETKIKKNINNLMYEQGADEMSDVTNSGTGGLVKRRKAEINIFKNNIYDSTH